MKDTDISKKARDQVFARDNIDGCLCCIYCGSPRNVQLAHYTPRSQGGLGIPENLAPLCVNCHVALDSGADLRKKEFIRDVFRVHLKNKYPGWSKEVTRRQK